MQQMRRSLELIRPPDRDGEALVEGSKLKPSTIVPALHDVTSGIHGQEKWQTEGQNDPRRTRTCNLQDRSLMLYPLSQEAS